MRDLLFFLGFVFIGGLGLGLVFTPVLIRFAHFRKYVDKPGHRKTHSEPVAYLGGVAVFTSILVIMAAAFPLGLKYLMEPFSVHKIFVILACSFGVTLVGLWDDIAHLRPLFKFLGQALFAVLFAVFGFRFEVLQVPGFPGILLGYLEIPVTVFWTLSIVNAVNMIDGVDGLAGTVVSGAFLMIAAASALLGGPSTLLISLAALGALLGFLRYNWSPAKVYLGDAGSNGLGMLLACVLISLGQFNPRPLNVPHLGAHDPQPFPFQIFIVTLFLAYPALEILLSIARRLLKGRSLTRADKGHIHHRMIHLGLNSKAISLSALVVTFLSGGAALAFLDGHYGKGFWFLAVLALLLGVSLQLLGFLNYFRPADITKRRPHFQIAHHFINMQLIKLRLTRNWEEVMVLVNQTCTEFGVQGYRLFVRPGPDKKGGFHSSWERPLNEHREHLNAQRGKEPEGELTYFKDHVELEGNKGEAFWIFEPHSKEEDLDVEYRVLVSEFMSQALGRIADLKPSVIVATPPDTAFQTRGSLSSNLLRRRSARPKP